MKGSTSFRSVKGVTSPAECCQYCAAESACAAFTYRIGSHKNASARVCLFHSKIHATNKGHCWSAHVTHPPSPAPSPAPKPGHIRNILHIIVDDLRPELGAYGRKMHTPEFDTLATKSTLFDRAYVQVALCGPTRQSFLTGRRPDATRAYDFANNFREIGIGDTWWPMPQIFREAGWLSLGTGKVYPPNNPPHFDGSNSWSPEALQDGKGYKDYPQENCPEPPAGTVNASNYSPSQVGGETRYKHGVKSGGFSAGLQGCALPTYQDPNVTANAIAYMRAATEQQKPFYLAVGLHKPHLPFHAPKEFHDLYPDDQVSLPQYKTFPEGAPDIAFHDNNGHPDVPSPSIPLPDNRTRAIRKQYMAAVSFMDSQLGKLLQALEELHLVDNTAIAFHGDHGWQLGEHNTWRKMTVFELGTRVPLLIHVPWLPQSANRRSSELVEMIDLLPTLIELANLTLPTNQTYDGVSLVPALTNGKNTTTRKNSSFSQYPRVLADHQAPPFPLPPDNHTLLWVDNRAGSNPRNSFYAIGHSMRTDRWRYTEWVRWNASADSPAWDLPLVGRELYDHASDVIGDFDSYERVNLAGKAQYASEVDRLSGSLRYFFRDAECVKTLCSPEEVERALAAQGMGNFPGIDRA